MRFYSVAAGPGPAPASALQSTLLKLRSSGLSYNPVLKYQPNFASSLPVQVLLTGIIFALTCVLLLHLCFTAQYHWPLAPVNFVLQMSGVLSLLISQIATLHVVLSTTMLESQNWPYMLTYLAVDIPPLHEIEGWSTAELAAWLIMNATTSGLIQVRFWISVYIRGVLICGCQSDHAHPIFNPALPFYSGETIDPLPPRPFGCGRRHHATPPDPLKRPRCVLGRRGPKRL